MTSRKPIICDACIHLDRPLPFGRGEDWTCTAFPVAIPSEIRIGENDHREFIGDEPVVFEMDPEEHDLLQLIDKTTIEDRRRLFG